MSVTVQPLVSLLARLYPWPVQTSEEFREAILFLDWDVSPRQLVKCGYGAGIVVGFSTLPVIPFVPAAVRLVLVLLSCGLVFGVAHLVHSLPVLAATARRTKALGAAPDLVARTVLHMRLTPTPERAASFAAETSDSVLARTLASHLRRTRNTARSGLVTFGEAWEDLFPALGRSFALVIAATKTRKNERFRLLDRSLTIVLGGARDELQAFAARIRGPVTALYAFGVLLPTALVALLPAATFADIIVSPILVIVVYNVLLPAVLLAAAIWLITNRPVAFPPPDVTHRHPSVTDRHRLAVVCGFGVAVASWVLTAWLYPLWALPVAALGLGCGTALLVANYPVIAVYTEIRAIEEGLPDALELVGRRVSNGRAVEAAIAQVGEDLDGPIGRVMADGARQQRQLNVGVEEAFLGRYGVLDDIPSPRVRGSFSLLSLAAHEGRPAGNALLSFAEHVEELQRIERDARQQLSTVCRTLSNTATIFGPMVAGSTVALANSISDVSELTGSEQSFTWLGGPVGVYVIVLAVILSALSVGLVRGFDRALIGYRVGRALVSGTLVYLCSYFVVGTFI